jgi:hypothetical protein
MRGRPPLKRKACFVDESALREARKVLGVKTEAEAIRLSVARVIEMGRFWKFMGRSRGTVRPGGFDHL